jgi:hypothetical protein
MLPLKSIHVEASGTRQPGKSTITPTSSHVQLGLRMQRHLPIEAGLFYAPFLKHRTEITKTKALDRALLPVLLLAEPGEVASFLPAFLVSGLDLGKSLGRRLLFMRSTDNELRRQMGAN